MTQISIFYTGDIHGHVDRLLRLAHLAQTARQQLAKAAQHSILVDSGGVEERSLLESDLSKGVAMYRLLQASGYHASAVGGSAALHYGPHVLRSIARASQIPLLSANMLVRGDPPTPVPGTRPTLVLSLGRAQVGLIGLTHEHNGLFEHHFPIIMPDAVQTTRYYLDALRAQGCLIVGVLSHLGYDRDVRLAQALPDLDFIIGGRSHTVLPTPANVYGVPVCHAGSFAQHVGRLDLTLDAAGAVSSWSGELLPVPENGPSHSATSRTWRLIVQESAERMEETIGYLNEAVTVRADRACSAGQLLADALRVRTQADAALCATWHLAHGLPAGAVSMRHIVEAAHSPCNAGTTYVTGRQIIRALEYGAKMDVWQASQPVTQGMPVGLLQVSGISYHLDIEAPDGQRVSEVRITNQPIDLDRVYRLAATDFELNPVRGYFPDLDLDAVQFDVPWVVREVLQAHLEQFSPLTPGMRPRIRRLDLHDSLNDDPAPLEENMHEEQ